MSLKIGQIGCNDPDIRGRLTDDNTIVLHHGPLYLYVTLHEFINEAKQFLKDNPSETIIMSLKKSMRI